MFKMFNNFLLIFSSFINLKQQNNLLPHVIVLENKFTIMFVSNPAVDQQSLLVNQVKES